MDNERPQAYVGVDWATESHEVCVVDESGEVLARRTVPHSGAGLDDLCRWLLGPATGAPESVWVAIEVPHGPVVEILLERGFTVFSINPKQLDRFRDRFTVAGAKDDRLDALVLADSLRTDTRHFRRLEVDDATVIELREWSRMAEELKQERVRLCNRVREQLRRYFPQFLALNDDVAADWVLDLWERLPSPARAKRVHEGTVAKILKSRRIRKVSAAEILAKLREPPLKVAAGTLEAATAHIKQLVPRLRLVNTQFHQCERQLDRLLDALSHGASPLEESDHLQRAEQRDVVILRSLPGIGRTNLATLLAEASQPLKARQYHILRALSGVAPVTRRSGKRWTVTRRQACHPRLREALYHWARVAVQCDPVSRQAYAALRQRGHTHGRAIRGVGDRLLNVACAMLRSGTLYDPTLRRAYASAVAA
jgi:transposase